MILMAVKPKLRPDDVPVGNVKRKSGAVTESIRPKTIEKRPRDRAKEFGDLEFRWSLDQELIKNPIARLGFKNLKSTDKVADFNDVEGYVDYVMSTPTLKTKASNGLQTSNDKELKEELLYYYNAVPEIFDNATYFYSENTPAQTKATIESGSMAIPRNRADETLPDDIFVDTDVASPRVWAHEMTHRGFNRLIEYKDQIGDEEFRKKYGRQALSTLKQIERSPGSNEFFTEYFDFVDDTWNYPNRQNMGRGDKEKFLDSNTVKDIEKFQSEGPGVYGKKNPQYGGLGYLVQAAEDILKEVEPPRATPYSHLSFMGRLRKKLGFAKGGTVMNEQMKMAFMMDEGGLKDDGMEKDPVSGNEVPSGSMAKEVRDDIPAQLSEGEYVVPADVVRYYGVKFFEDLRERAKIGLQDMEMNGRIGGEPVPAGGPMNDEELSPEEMQAIQEMMGMFEGGSINALKTQQELLEQPPAKAQGNPVMMADGGEVKGYAPGGLEQSFLDTGQQAVNRGFVGFPLGSTIFPSEKTGQTALGPAGTQVATTKAIDTAITGTAGTDTSILTTVTLYGPNGEIVTLTLPTDQARYDQLISEGYTTEMPVAGEPVVKGGGNGGGDKVTSDGNAWMDKFDYTGDFSTNNLAQQTSDTLKKAPVGGVIGAFINGSNAAQAAANIIILEENGGDPTEIAKLKAEYQKFIKDTNLSYLPKELINGDALAKDIVRNNIDIALDRESVDVNGEPIFKDDDEFNKLMQDVSSEGMEFDPVSRSYKRKKRRDIGEILRGKKVETTPAGVNVYQATKDTPRPVARPTPPTEPIYTYTASDLANAKAVDDGLAAKATEDMIEQQREAARKAASDRRKDKRKANRDRTRNKLSAKDRVKNYKSGGQKFRGQGGRAEGGLMSKGKNK